MRRLHSDSCHPVRKDVPHLSESLLIGIERWQFVESDVNESAKILDALFTLIMNAFFKRRRKGNSQRQCSAGLIALLAIMSAQELPGPLPALFRGLG
jgi:hypothetical protein